MITAITDYLTHTYLNGYVRSGQIFINTIDTDTGLLVVTYGTVVNYVISGKDPDLVGQATFLGQSGLSVFTNNTSDHTPGTQQFDIRVEITSVIPGTLTPPDTPPPTAGACDLVINSYTIDKIASSPGSRDAQITLNATSSYLPIQYSSNSRDWQLSPIFTGLAGGLVQPIAKDANPNGCMAETNIVIPVSPNKLVSGPDVTLPGGNRSRWSAAFNPIVFTYQRKDVEVLAVVADAATGNAILETGTSMNDSVTGTFVWVNAPPYIGAYKVYHAENANAHLIIDEPFVGSGIGYMNANQLRPYYQVQTVITHQDLLTQQTKTITSTNRPDNTGLIKADLSNFLQSLLQAKDNSDFMQPNYRDVFLSASYQVAYAEMWDGRLTVGEQPAFISLPNPYYVVYAAKQLGDKYGGNLAEFVPFRSIGKGASPAKLITEFTEPAYSPQYPFDIGFIYSEDLLGLDIYCEMIPLDVNRNPVGRGTQTSALLNEDSSWLLNQDGSRLLISRQAAINKPLPQQLGLNRLLINVDFADDIHYFTLTLKYNDENGKSIALTQTKTLRIDDAVDENSVYLRWIGLTGSWNYYRFVYNQEITLDVQNAVIIKNYVSDWENQDGIEQVISKSAGQKMKVIAEDLSVSDIKGLQSIKYSPKVQMLVSKSPVKWQTIVLNTATFSEYETINGQAPFSVTFNMPSINIQTQ